MKPITASWRVKNTRLYYQLPERTSVSLPSELLDKMRGYKERWGYSSMSSLIVRCCEAYLIQAEKEGKI